MERLTTEDLEFLAQLANELRTQERYATARPVIFKVRVPEKVWCIEQGYADDTGLLMGDDANECLTVADAKDWLADGDVAPEDLANLTTLEEIADFCEKSGIRCTLTGYKESETFHGAFLTRSGYERHMAMNRHNYGAGASFYVDHAYRNPELERLLRIVDKFATVAAEAKAGD